MNQATLEKQLSKFKSAECSTPFGPDALVFKVLNKMFALVSQNETIPRVTLKCLPDNAEVLVSQFDAITPGYYMNKKHWITISLTEEISTDMMQDLSERSYNLVVKKLSKADKKKLVQNPSEIKS